MATKSFFLSNGKVLIVKAVENHVELFYEEAGEEKKKVYPNMKQLRIWIKKHFNEEL
jgi:hypothetical protein